MTKRIKKKHRWVFPLLLTIYAFAFLGATALGLDKFWNYIEAYEQSRPHIALDAYMEALTPEYICNASEALIAKIDHGIQSESQCRNVILAALEDEITCAKKSSESTEDRQVYVLLCGKQVIGSMEMERCADPAMGFTPWVVTGDTFDLSYLLTEPVSLTVPSDYPMYVNDNLLDAKYITEDQILYDALKEYYGSYSLPYLVTYTAGPFLGVPDVLVTDPSGKEVSIENDMDMSVFLDLCSQEEIDALSTAADAFIRRYIDFTSNTKNDSTGNLRKLAEYMVPNGDLYKRMHAALDGLIWVSDRGASLASMDIDRCIDIGDGRYLCDLTYVVNTKNYTGTIQSINCIKIIFASTANGLKAETMISY